MYDSITLSRSHSWLYRNLVVLIPDDVWIKDCKRDENVNRGEHECLYKISGCYRLVNTVKENDRGDECRNTGGDVHHIGSCVV